MKTFVSARVGFLCFWFGCVISSASAQFVELSVELEITDWAYLFRHDRDNPPWSGSADSSIFAKRGEPIRCVVGTNTWMMEGAFASNARVTYWFTGTNVIERHQITSELPKEKVVRIPGFPVAKAPAIGSVHSTSTESVDGNPGRPVRVSDLMMSPAEMICWLALCSAPVVRGKEPRIPLPSAFWKQHFPVGTKFTNDFARFEDDLGLPTGITVCTETGELGMQYQVHHSTNVLGWNFPTEFYLAQYKPVRWRGTNSWEVQLTAKARVTVTGPVAAPQIPEDALRSARRRDR